MRGGPSTIMAAWLGRGAGRAVPDSVTYDGEVGASYPMDLTGAWFVREAPQRQQLVGVRLCCVAAWRRPRGRLWCHAVAYSASTVHTVQRTWGLGLRSVQGATVCDIANISG